MRAVVAAMVRRVLKRATMNGSKLGECRVVNRTGGLESRDHRHEREGGREYRSG
jgi:alkylated DNA nucleotide flippase Atl1